MYHINNIGSVWFILKTKQIRLSQQKLCNKELSVWKEKSKNKDEYVHK